MSMAGLSLLIMPIPPDALENVLVALKEFLPKPADCSLWLRRHDQDRLKKAVNGPDSRKIRG